MGAALPRAAPVTLFYSYAHEDEALRDELQGHLKLLERRGLLAPWHDRSIVPGADWAAEISAELERAELVLLLVSKDFLASDYIVGVELAVAMRRQAEATASVVPIIVRAVDLDVAADADDLPFLRLQGLPTDLRPVTSWPNRDEAWTDVAKGLRKAVEAIRARRPVVAPPAYVARDPIDPVPAAPPLPRSPPAEPFGGRARPDIRFSPAAPLPDALLDRIVTDVTARIAAAQQGRGGAPFDAEAVATLQHETRALIDAPDQKRVLWVDDHPEGNRFEAAALAKLQIEVVAVRDTDAALQTLARDIEGFDLVISDWERPAEGAQAGLRLIARMRAAGVRLPVVCYHAGRGDARRARAAQAAAAGAIGEAVAPDELMALVAKALAPPLA